MPFLPALVLVSAASCTKPDQPAVVPPPAVDASSEIQAIRREERQSAGKVKEVARSEAAKELRNTAKALRGGSPEDGGLTGADAVESAHRMEEAEIAGKLEQATQNRFIIRDDSGFEYWLQTSDTTHVAQNGRPARLKDFKQGADVRASFVWRGNERVATDVDVVGGELADGGELARDHALRADAGRLDGGSELDRGR